MKKLQLYSVTILLLLGNYCFSQQGSSVVSNANDISETSKIFKEHFFDALSNRGIGQHEKAIKDLGFCIKENSNIPVLYYELAQNEISLRFYDSAKKSLDKALAITPNSVEALKSLSQVYFILQNFDQRIATLVKLSAIDSKYQYNLAQAYRYSQQYKEALEVLNKYQKIYSYDSRIEYLRNQIYASSLDKALIIEDIEKGLIRNSNNENAYVQLIGIHKSNNDEANALSTIKRFKATMPNAPMLEYFNFQDYLEKGDTVKAAESMRKLTANGNVSQSTKTKMLSDFEKFSKKNKAINKTEAPIASQSNSSRVLDENFKFVKELSFFTVNENEAESLLEVYQNNLKSDTNNYSLIKETLLLQLYYGKVDNAEKLVETGIEKYPSQPFLYLTKGSILAKEDQTNEAIKNFKEGLDYIVDDSELERILYLKLSQSYAVNGDKINAKKYQDKGEKIEISN